MAPKRVTLGASICVLLSAAGMVLVLGQAWAHRRSKKIAIALIAAFLQTIFLPTSVLAQSFEGLGVLPGGSVSLGFGINADGSVVVGRGNSANFSSEESFRWTQSGGMVGLGVIAGTTQSSASGVNADGLVVVGGSTNNGSASPTTGFFGEAFRWTQSGGMVGLGVISGGTRSQANAVSGDGTVVVGQGNSTFIPTNEEAFRWTQAGGMVGLGFIPGGSSSSIANAVNSDGSVVVGQSFLTAAGYRAFRWTQSSGS